MDEKYQEQNEGKSISHPI